jgi:hypothetical protein
VTENSPLDCHCDDSTFLTRIHVVHLGLMTSLLSFTSSGPVSHLSIRRPSEGSRRLASVAPQLAGFLLCAEPQLSRYGTVVADFTFLALYRQMSDTMLPHNSVNPSPSLKLIIPAPQTECHVSDTMATPYSRTGMRYLIDSTDTTFSNIFDDQHRSLARSRQLVNIRVMNLSTRRVHPATRPNSAMMSSHARA